MSKWLKGKTLAVLVTFLIATVLFPVQSAEAAEIKRFAVVNYNPALPMLPYLIAGVPYTAIIETNSGFGTSVAGEIQYNRPFHSTGWETIRWGPAFFEGRIGFRLPLTPALTQIALKAKLYFDPLIGSKSESERRIDLLEVKYPTEHSDLEAVANADGTVTLTWMDNSNMEDFYIITRRGPKDTKTFYIENTQQHLGQLSFLDKTTNGETLYVYTVTAQMGKANTDILTRYGEPELAEFPLLHRIVITKPTKPTLQLDRNIISGMRLSDGVATTLPDYVKPAKKVKLEEMIVQDIFVNFDKLGTLPSGQDVDQKYSVTGVSLVAPKTELRPDEVVQLTATVAPATAMNKNVMWKSDNSLVATVDSSGLVTAQAAGQATISVQTEDGGLIASVDIEVVDNPPDIGPASSGPSFPDVPDHHWARDEIAAAVKNNLIYGYPDGAFQPDGVVTRAEFAAMLMRGMPTMPQAQPLTFADKATIGPWAVEFVQQAVAQGIITGYPDGTFRPDAKITHAEMITMVVRASGLDVGLPRPTAFADDADIPDWAKAPTAAAADHSFVFGGISGNRFQPGANSTRAEAASTIVKMLRATGRLPD